MPNCLEVIYSQTSLSGTYTNSFYIITCILYLCTMCTFHPQQISCIYLIGFLTSKLPTTAPEKGEDWNKIFNDVEELIVPGVCEININYM
mgnify:FL=1